MAEKQPGLTYAQAGVDIDAGNRMVELIKPLVRATARPGADAEIGGFGGLFDLKRCGFTDPVLVAANDGVGTKVKIAIETGRHDTIGIDLVAMVVDDLVVVGAEPLFLTDYIATGRVVPEKIATIVAGVAEGCVQAGCALVGGETAEHPGVMSPDEYDISGTGVGVVNADGVLGPDRVADGDVLIALGSSGLHSNGYSLVRHVLLERGGLALDATPDGLDGRSLADELLVPTRIYARDCLALAADADAHAFAHITGGGLAGNVVRVLPDGLVATVDRATWSPPPIFDLIAVTGDVSRAQMELTFNLGVGMIAAMPPQRAAEALAILADRGVPAWTIGDVVEGSGQVRMSGEYAAG